ncbi:Chromo domain-containing protein, partial [Cephalotus follicularis]
QKNLKLSPRYYEPFQIIEKIGMVAHKLQLPSESKIHPVSHVSCLKKKIGSNDPGLEELPIISNDKDAIVIQPQAILDRRIRKKQAEVLVHWKGLTPADATWENQEDLKLRFL